MFVIVFWAALLLVAYTYLIYPLLLWLLTLLFLLAEFVSRVRFNICNLNSEI